MQAFVAFLISVVIALIWTYNHILGIRAFAISTMLIGGYWLYTGRIPFTFNERHISDINGPTAFLISWAIIVLGAWILVYPEVIAAHFLPGMEYAPLRR